MVLVVLLQVRPPPISSSFNYKSLLSIADDHPANGVTEEHVWSELSDMALERYRCMVHKEKAVGDFSQSPSEYDTRAVLHSCLGFRYSGSSQRWKNNVKKNMRAPGGFSFYPYGRDGAGEEARLFREKVFNVFGGVAMERGSTEVKNRSVVLLPGAAPGRRTAWTKSRTRS